MIDERGTQRGRSRFVPNTVALVLQTIFATLITLAQVKILSTSLDRGTFGLFASLRGFSLLLAMIAANGIPQLLIRFIPVHESRGERARARALSAVAFAGALFLLGLIGAAAWPFRSQLLSFVPAAGRSNELVIWFGVTTAAVMLKQILYGGLGGMRRLSVQVSIELVSLFLVLSWIFVARDSLTLERLFFILGVVNGLAVLAGTPLYFGLMRRTPQGKGADEVGTSYRGYLVWATGLSLVAIAFTDVDRYLLAQVLTLETLALFHIGARVARLGHRLLAMPALAFQPEVTRIAAEGRREAIAHATAIFTKFNVAASMIVTAGLVLFAREIIIIVASRDYTAAVPLMVILAVTLPVTTIAAPLTTVMKALDQARDALVVDLAWALVYIGLILTLGHSFGLIGVGVASLGASLVQLITARRLSRLTFAAGFTAGLLSKLVLAAAVAWAPALVVDAVLGGPVGVIARFVLFLAGVAVYPRLTRALRLFEQAERKTLTAMLQVRGLRLLGKVV